MGESLTEQYLVSDEGFRVVKLSQQGRRVCMRILCRHWRYLQRKPRLITCQQPR